MKVRNLALACLVVLASATATAPEPANQVTPMTVNADTREDFAAVAEDVRAEMAEGGRFEFLSKSERQAVEDAFRRMDLLFQTSPTVEGMNKEDKVALFNQQEVVNSILKNRDSDRVVCKRERKTGSNLATTTCLTYGERERQRRDSVNELTRIQKGASTSIQ
jgi:hypothetical protein